MENLRRVAVLLLVPAGSFACDDGRSLQRGGSIAGEELNPYVAGQTGDEGAKPWRPGGTDDETVCPLRETTESLASIEEDTELGFSAGDVLGLVVGGQATRVHWNARPVTPDFTDYVVQVTPGNVDETLTLAVSHDGSLPGYRGLVVHNGDAGVSHCRGRLEVGVTMDMRSESGALDERWWGTLTASDVGEAVVVLQAPTWRGRLPNQPDRDQGNFVNELEGSLDAVDAVDPGSKFAWVYVVLRLREGAIDGSVNGWIEEAKGGAFRMPQTTENDKAGWIGVIGDGFFEVVGGDQ